MEKKRETLFANQSLAGEVILKRARSLSTSVFNALKVSREILCPHLAQNSQASEHAALLRQIPFQIVSMVLLRDQTQPEHLVDIGTLQNQKPPGHRLLRGH